MKFFTDSKKIADMKNLLFTMTGTAHRRGWKKQVYRPQFFLKIVLFSALGLAPFACGDDDDPKPVNTAPKIEEQTFSIVENAENGTQVGMIRATDAEEEALTFSVTSGNTSNAFAINRSTGVLTAAGSLDFETVPTYTLAISVSDGELSATANITVNLEDVNETPTIDPDQTFSVPEDAANATTVGTVQAADPEKDQLTFSITEGNTGDVFAINTSTGAFTTAATLDFEMVPTYTLTISVSDGELSATDNITINVEDVNETETAEMLKEIEGLISTLADKQNGHLQTTGIANAQMKMEALKVEDPAAAATYKAAIDAIVVITVPSEEIIRQLQDEMDVITQKITALETAGTAPDGTIPTL
ncbi:MAG: cadherin repeat domain-containing protein, partial [Ekhidna sp.]|nr:cadherin repeat domain-containing protein [Ekhidna sp.]